MTGIPAQNAGTHQNLEALGSYLENPSYEIRQSAVGQLESIADDRAVELLCRALEDCTSGVTIAAAEALARIGNAAAIPALTRALRSHRLVSAPRRQRAAGLLLLFLWLFFGCVTIFADRFTPHPVFVGALCQIASMLCLAGKFVLRLDSRAHEAVTQSLAELVTRTGSPEGRDALPDLMDLARDIFVEDRKTRRAYRRAAEAIDLATARQRDLPRPTIGVARSGTLPIPGSSCVPQAMLLPRPAEPEA